MLKVATFPLLITVLLKSSQAYAKIAEGSCPLEDSIYVASDGSGVRAQFYKTQPRGGLVSSLVLKISGENLGGNWWYILDQGSSARITLISTTNPRESAWNPTSDGSPRPHGTASLIGLSGNGHVWSEAPTPASKAVKYILIPELEDAFKLYSRTIHYKNSAFIVDKCKIG